MEGIKFNYKDVLALVHIAMTIAEKDTRDERELASMVLSMQRIYDISIEECIENYFSEVAECDLEESMKIVSMFNREEKQFASDMLANVVAADRSISSKEWDYYLSICKQLGLPDYDPLTFHCDDAFLRECEGDIIPAFIDISFVENASRTESLVLFRQFGSQSVIKLRETLGAEKMWTVRNTDILNKINEQLAIPDMKVVLTYTEKGGTLNRLGTDIRGSKLFGHCFIGLEDSNKYFYGFTKKSDIRALLTSLKLQYDGKVFILGDADNIESENEAFVNFLMTKVNNLA